MHRATVYYLGQPRTGDEMPMILQSYGINYLTFTDTTRGRHLAQAELRLPLFGIWNRGVKMHSDSDGTTVRSCRDGAGVSGLASPSYVGLRWWSSG